MIEAAQKIDYGLQSQSLAFREMVFVQSGAWHWLQEYDDVGKIDTIPLTNVTPIDGKLIHRNGMVIQERTELQSITGHIFDLLQSDGGFQIRALTRDGMDFWWTYGTNKQFRSLRIIPKTAPW